MWASGRFVPVRFAPSLAPGEERTQGIRFVSTGACRVSNAVGYWFGLCLGPRQGIGR